MYLLLGDAVAPTISDLAQGVITSITSHVDLAAVATVMGVIIGAGIVAIFAWKFARKGFAFVVNSLSGKRAKM